MARHGTLGNGEKVTFVPLKSSERFPALQSGAVDLLARNTTCTHGREAGLKVMFPGTTFYDGQAFMVPASSGIREIRHLDGATICAEKETTHQQYLADYFTVKGMRLRPLVIDSSTAGRRGAYTSDASQLAVALEMNFVGPIVLTAIIRFRSRSANSSWPCCMC